MKVKVISLPYIFQVLYVLCFTRPRYQVSVYRTIGPLVSFWQRSERLQLFYSVLKNDAEICTKCVYVLYFVVVDRKNCAKIVLRIYVYDCLL